MVQQNENENSRHHEPWLNQAGWEWRRGMQVWQRHTHRRTSRHDQATNNHKIWYYMRWYGTCIAICRRVHTVIIIFYVLQLFGQNRTGWWWLMTFDEHCYYYYRYSEWSTASILCMHINKTGLSWSFSLHQQMYINIRITSSSSLLPSKRGILNICRMHELVPTYSHNNEK